MKKKKKDNVGACLSFQILDGFIVVASVDGTILYVSENVTQYIGFHQVCIRPLVLIIFSFCSIAL